MKPIWEAPDGVSASFTAALQEIAPESDRFAWLLPVWVAGDPWQPINRWIVYQMLPFRHTPSFLLRDLDGENPRNRGTWHPRIGYQPDPACFVDRMQWLLWREHRAFGRPYWVVQGGRGGHRRRLDHTEKIVRMTAGKSADVPDPGDLPFAGLDGRVLTQLRQFRTIEFEKQAVAAEHQDPSVFEAGEREAIANMRSRLDQWLDAQIDSVVDEMPGTMQQRAFQQLHDLSRPVDGTSWDRSVERQRRDLLELGV